MEWVIPILLVIGFTIIFFFKSVGSTKEFPYITKSSLFSPAERSFFGVLTQASADNAVVFGKVRIADILEPTKGLDRSGWQKAFNKISSKHFDYVVCNPGDLSVKFVIELDDKTHSRKKQLIRDAFIQSACESAGLRLHRFKASSSYSISEVREILFPSATLVTRAVEQSLNFTSDGKEQKASCPKCSSELVLRIANKGKHKGEEFMGCSAFPKCRYISKPGT